MVRKKGEPTGALNGEMDAHLTQTRKVQRNRRNGHTQKTIQSPLGGFEVFSPRDRNSTFEPQIVEKRRHSISSDIDQQIIALYGRGMSYSDIQGHLMEIYGLAISDATLTAITDRIMPQIKDWQNRVLESVYPVVWMDAMHYKVRENGKVMAKAIYSVLGVTLDGQKEVLGIYFGNHESASFWRQVLNELQMRGVEDIMVVCIDNLRGFGDAVEDIYPRTDVQLCLVHQMRNSMKYMSDKDVKPIIEHSPNSDSVHTFPFLLSPFNFLLFTFPFFLSTINFLLSPFPFPLSTANPPYLTTIIVPVLFTAFPSSCFKYTLYA